MKLTDQTFACNDTTSFECEVNESYINLQKLAWKNSWKHFGWTYTRRVLAIWNHCAHCLCLTYTLLGKLWCCSKTVNGDELLFKVDVQEKDGASQKKGELTRKKIPILNFVAPPPPPFGPYSCRRRCRRTRLDPCAVQGFFPNVLHHLFRDQKGL